MTPAAITQQTRIASMRHGFCLGLLLLLAACVPSTNYYPQTVHSWQGANINTLMKHWGAPDEQATDPDGHSVYLYKTVSYSNVTYPTGPAIGVGTSRSGAAEITTQAPNTNMTWNRGMSLSCLVIFTTNQQGTITSTKINGQTCYGGQTFSKRMSNPARAVMLAPPKNT